MSQQQGADEDGGVHGGGMAGVLLLGRLSHD